MRDESYKAENTDEIVWLRLNRFKSVKLCENLIRKKANKGPSSTVSEEIVKAKSVGLSSAVDSAVGYWDAKPLALNAKVLSRYYFLLQMTIAEQVSSVRNQDDLASIQKHTENGHGLGTLVDTSRDFPLSFFSFAIRTGHFYSYAKSLGLDTKPFDFERRPRKYDDVADKDKLVNIVDLFRRIPELSNVIEEYTGQPPLAFHIGHASSNLQRESEAAKEHTQKTGQFTLQAPAVTPTKTTDIAFYSDSTRLTPDYLASLDLPFSDYKIEQDDFSGQSYIIGRFEHPSDRYWHQSVRTYSSAYSPTSIVVPLWKQVDDPVIINFILLYSLSIIVRYLPDLWYRINSGELNHIGSLVEYYTSVLDHTLPLLMLERITETRIAIHQPGSIFGPT